MTAYAKISAGRQRTQRNRKDGGVRRQVANWEKYGFEYQGERRWGYTWMGNFPTFIIGPGVLDGICGLVARCEAPAVELVISYGTSPQQIAKTLDEQILEIMRFDADAQDAIIDYDQWCQEQYAEIYEEIPF